MARGSKIIESLIYMEARQQAKALLDKVLESYSLEEFEDAFGSSIDTEEKIAKDPVGFYEQLEISL